MTVQDITPVINYQYTGPGDYSFGFKAFKAEDLSLTYRSVDGVTSTLVLGTDYTVTIDPNVLGGVCTLITPTNTDGTLIIKRSMSYIQETDWVNNDPLNVELLESDLDKAIMLIQEIHEEVLEGLQTGTWKSDWQNSTEYVVGDKAANPTTGNIYVALIDHTSNASGTMEDDMFNWEIFLDLTSVSTSESNAAASASAAATSETNALASMNAAATSETNALNSANAAATSAGEAQQYANTCELNLNTIPVGMIVPWLGGYFTDGNNGGYTDVLAGGTDIAAANSYLSGFGFRVCDGSEYYNVNSQVFNAAGRFLPNLTDDRFIQGSNIGGQSGGINSIDNSHSHVVLDHVLTLDEIPSHSHTGTTSTGGNHQHHIDNIILHWNPGNGEFAEGSNMAQEFTGYTDIAGNHNHTFTTDTIGSGAGHNHGNTGLGGSLIDNRPQFLTCFYAIRVTIAGEDTLNYFMVQPE